MSRPITKDYDMILNCWGPVAADYPAFGAMMFSRFLQRFPDSHKYLPRCGKVPHDELATSPVVAKAGTIKLKRIHAMLKCKGDHTAIVQPLATLHATAQIPLIHFRHMIEILAEVMGEQTGVDNDVKQALKKSMSAVWVDFDRIYKELGLAA